MDAKNSGQRDTCYTARRGMILSQPWQLAPKKYMILTRQSNEHQQEKFDRTRVASLAALKFEQSILTAQTLWLCAQYLIVNRKLTASSN